MFKFSIKQNFDTKLQYKYDKKQVLNVLLLYTSQ